MINKYHVWKSKSNGEPIEGTDRILTGVNARSVVQHLAFEEGIEPQQSKRLVRCEDGTVWHVLFFY